MLRLGLRATRFKHSSWRLQRAVHELRSGGGGGVCLPSKCQHAEARQGCSRYSLDGSA